MDETNEIKNGGDIPNDVDDTSSNDNDTTEDSADSVKTSDVHLDESKELEKDIGENLKEKKDISKEKSIDGFNDNSIEKSKENNSAKDNIDKLLDSALQDFDKKKPKKVKSKKEPSPKSQEDDLLNLFSKTGIGNLSSLTKVSIYVSFYCIKQVQYTFVTN